jgi:hypothetical protein
MFIHKHKLNIIISKYKMCAVQEERKKVVENSVPTHWIAEHHDRAQVNIMPVSVNSSPNICIKESEIL